VRLKEYKQLGVASRDGRYQKERMSRDYGPIHIATLRVPHDDFAADLFGRHLNPFIFL